MSDAVPTDKLADMKIENGVTVEDTAPTPTPSSPPTDSIQPAVSPASTPPPASFKQIFQTFAKFGDTKSDGKHITLSQSDKWMKQAKVIDGKKITTTDTGIYFKKLKAMKVTFDEYHKFLEDLAKNKKIEVDTMKTKMANCGPPGLHGVQTGKSAASVDRLTDVSKYTGSHKQRFDQTGKGKGIAGRKDIAENSGYVAGYINKNTYDKTH